MYHPPNLNTTWGFWLPQDQRQGLIWNPQPWEHEGTEIPLTFCSPTHVPWHGAVSIGKKRHHSNWQMVGICSQAVCPLGQAAATSREHHLLSFKLGNFEHYKDGTALFHHLDANDQILGGVFSFHIKVLSYGQPAALIMMLQWLLHMVPLTTHTLPSLVSSYLSLQFSSLLWNLVLTDLVYSSLSPLKT